MAATFNFITFLPRLFESRTLLIQLGCMFLHEFCFFLYFKNIYSITPKPTINICFYTNHIYRGNDNDIRQTSALPIQKNTSTKAKGSNNTDNCSITLFMAIIKLYLYYCILILPCHAHTGVNPNILSTMVTPW